MTMLSSSAVRECKLMLLLPSALNPPTLPEVPHEGHLAIDWLHAYRYARWEKVRASNFQCADIAIGRATSCSQMKRSVGEKLTSPTDVEIEFASVGERFSCAVIYWLWFTHVLFACR